MAEACRLGSNVIGNKVTNPKDENFCILNVLCVFISLVTILADLTTDVIVFAEYCKDEHLYWALWTLVFILTPNIVANLFSLRWFITDQNSTVGHWITHICLFGLLERYIIFLRKVFVCKNLETIKTHKLLSQRNDLSLLHFLYIFTGTVPQIVLQTYAIVILDENYYTKVFSLTASLASVVWGCSTYIYSTTIFSTENFNWKSALLRFMWNFGMLVGRISGILLFTILFGVWTLLPLGLHWSAMTFWIFTQKTIFCPSKLEEIVYNAVMGFVYCFCYINLKDGHTRYRLILYYTLIISQNFGCLLIYILITENENQKKSWSIVATSCIVFGTIIGLCSMISYYKCFHQKGPIIWKTRLRDIELNNKSAAQDSNSNNKSAKNTLNQVRSFKTCSASQLSSSNISSEAPLDQSQMKRTETPDKKILLDHWIARAGTPTFTSAPIGNISMDVSSIEVYTLENTPQTVHIRENIQKHNILQQTISKKTLICSPTELALKLSSVENIESSIDEITSNNLNLHKRRGICSSDDLNEHLTKLNVDICNIVNEDIMKIIKNDHISEISHDTDGSNKKTSSDSIDMDLDLSFSDINSSDINTFNENIVQKLCLSALKNIKVGNQDADIENIQRIALDILKEMYAKKGKNKNSVTTQLLVSKSRDLDTPTEILSVHDYENICAVNIAREAWGLRSWNGYFDIENWLHDGSVVRDRRHDTLTSASSEISSCISQDLKNAILSAPQFPKKAHTYSNVFVKFDKTNQEDYANTLVCQDDSFLTKSCLYDICKDSIHLEPILEELDDLGDVDPSSKKRLNSKSSLVATIDEIRKSTVSNSPRVLYHRRDRLWNTAQINTTPQTDSTLTEALWKEPSKFDSSNIMESLPEKENIQILSQNTFESNKKEINVRNRSSTHSFDAIDNVITYSKNTRRRQKLNSGLKPSGKKNNLKAEQNIQDLSNKNIDILWQLVTENTSAFASIEDCSANRMSSSLQSLIQKDSMPVVNTATTKVSNIKKQVRNKPRRKFSILRERFEPKCHLNSDEEILCQTSEKASQPTESNIINLKNQINLREDRKNGHIGYIQNNIPISESTSDRDVKEKRSLFMKQVINPPKFNTKLRHKV